MGTVVVCAYEHIEINEHYPKKPLLIACSGGGGHISAIEGVCDYLQRRYSEALILPSYTPVLLESKETSMSRIHIRNGVKIMSAPIVGRALRKAVAITALPVLPYEDDIEEELSKLTTLEARKQKRNYIDMLLDVYPDGYESAAVWNVLQRHDQARELNKLISFQYLSDKTNYNNVYTYYRDMLKRAARKNVPYTEVISTQAMAIPALCDAVRDYNNWVAAKNLPYPPVVIHQYMTDMPTVGAINFFKSLANLTPEQQYQLRLYGVGLSEEVIQHVFPGQTNFAAIYAIPPEDNPMVRQGFTNPQFDNSQKFDKNTILELMGEEPFSLNPGEKIATIMLGSQAGQGAIDYLPHLLQEDFTRIFIFGGKTNPLLSQKIDTLIHTSPAYKQRLVPLSNQQDDAITALMTRSNLVIIRGGGLSIMEQLAMSHNPNQAILVHHSDDTHGAELTSGIPWEDANVEELIKALYKSGIYCAKTSINKISRNLMEITLLQLITSNHQEIAPADVIHHLQQLSDSQVQQFLMDVQSQSHTTNTLIPRELELHLQQCERQAKDFVTLLNKTLGEYLQKLKLEIIKDVKTLDLSSFLAINPLTKEIISLDELDVLQIVNKVDDALFKNSPSTFFNNAQAYRLFHRLQGILLDDNQSSSHQKLYQFKENYQQVNMRLSRLNKAFQAVVNQILLILIKYFPSLREKLPPHLELSVVMTHLNNPHAKGPGFFSRRQENESTDSSLETSLASP